MIATINGLHVVGFSAAVLALFWLLGVVFAAADGIDDEDCWL